MNSLSFHLGRATHRVFTLQLGERPQVSYQRCWWPCPPRGCCAISLSRVNQCREFPGITLRSCRMDNAYSHSCQKFCPFHFFFNTGMWEAAGSDGSTTESWDLIIIKVLAIPHVCARPWNDDKDKSDKGLSLKPLQSRLRCVQKLI